MMIYLSQLLFQAQRHMLNTRLFKHEITPQMTEVCGLLLQIRS